MHFPVSFSQQRLWFLDQLAPGEPTYNMPFSMWLDGPLDGQALQRALDAMVARHAALRTTIVAFDGVPEQVVAESGTLPLERVELRTGLDRDEARRQAEGIAAYRANQPFDLATGPLVRATLVAAGPDWHLFVLVMHHAISDGESMKILIGELSAAYRAGVTGVPPALPRLWMGYGDYAVWQQDRMRGEELDRQLGHWRERLGGAPRILTLPGDRPRPARQSVRGGVASVRLDAAASERLAEVAHGANATMFMVLLAGFAAVLSRYARHSDVVIGTQVAGRTHTELDPIVGMFTNTIPLRVSLAGDPSFAVLLDRVRDITLDALAHQETPFEKLVEEFVPDRTLAYSPLVQVQFVYGPQAPPGLELPGVTARSAALHTGTAKLDLSLSADDQDGRVRELALEYATDLFDQTWAGQFLRCLATLLEHAAQAPGTAVADLPLLSAAERHELIAGRNHPAVAEDIADIRSLLQASTSRVIDGGTALPMSEVCDRAARIARSLADRGIGPETTAGVCAERGIGMLTALLGVWWAGGAYVPLDPAFPHARLTAMARGAGLRVIISDATHHVLARSVGGPEVIRVDDPATTAVPPLAPVPLPGNALAYVIFTSGSTGQPKGAGVEHRGFANLLASFRRALSLGADDRVVAAAALSFDISLFELMLTLISGADLVIATADEAREPDRLRSLIERTAATAMQATPQTWRLLESAGGVPASLRLRLSGAEAIPAELAERLMTPGAVLWNLYGPTETAVWSSAGVVTSAATSREIGPPIDNVRVYVLDEHLRPVPAGVVGEVCIAGRAVTRGYHDKPRLTARSFWPDPWSDEPGARMYRTGDLGRWRAAGGLELIGRNDHQVKIRGFRIECGEIEAVLRAHRDVRQAVVVTAPRAGEPALVAYIVPRPGGAAAQPGADLLEVLRPHLRSKLPDYMIPALIVALSALPLTPTAKIDRKALPAPEWSTTAPAGRTEPRNEVEATLARIWADLLATDEPVGVHDNLFALGGHSLTATRFVARVADAYRVILPVHQVFACPTVAELAGLISADPEFGPATGSSRHADLDALSDEDLDDLLRAALAQRYRRLAGGGADQPAP